MLFRWTGSLNYWTYTWCIFNMQEAVFGKILTFLFAVVLFLQGNPFTFSIGLFKCITFGKKVSWRYFVPECDGCRCQLQSQSVHYLKMKCVKITYTLKEPHKFWEAMEMDLLVVCRCYTAVAHVPGAKFIHLMEKCACPTSIPIYKMCKRKGKRFPIGYHYWGILLYCSLLVNYWDKWLQEVLLNLFSCSPCSITFHSKG